MPLPHPSPSMHLNLDNMMTTIRSFMLWAKLKLFPSALTKENKINYCASHSSRFAVNQCLFNDTALHLSDYIPHYMWSFYANQATSSKAQAKVLQISLHYT